MDQNVTEICKNQPFGLICDESNDRYEEKNFVVLARLYNEDSCDVETRFIDMPICNIGTGQNLFDTITVSFSESNIPWQNVLAFSGNASVMKRQHNSVLSRIKTQQPNMFDLGCICHLANLVFGVGVKKFPLPVKDLLVNIYFHFDKSAKWSEFYQGFTSVESKTILKHCSTCWSSFLT